jgi:hypothetical protein
MSDAYWGVDSYNPASAKMGVKGYPTLFQYVCDQAGRVPDFWGRYITGKGEKLSAKEAEFIFNASGGATRILPIYNQAHPSATSLKGGEKEGVNDASKAIAAADALGIPAGVFLWCDIEPGWGTAAGWYRGWWKRMLDSQYGGMGGIYENPLPWNASFFSKPYLTALKGGSPWVAQDPPAKARYLWSQQPCKVNISPKVVPEFKPAQPEGVRGVTVLWQYAIDCLKTGGKWGNADFNLADETGYGTMWDGGGRAATLGQHAWMESTL